jgi:hypothetical protein
MFLFVILFGLSMDYHVFILSRVKELVDRGAKTEDAVVEGIRSTAGTVTSKWNWYLPSKLGWLPHISHEPAIEPARA